MEKNYWPALGLAIMVVGALLFLGGIVFVTAWVGYPFVSVLLVVISLAAFVSFITVANWDYLKPALARFFEGIGAILTLVCWSWVVQLLIANPVVAVALCFAVLCSVFSYNTFFPRKS